jgi:hypothetical protein
MQLFKALVGNITKQRNGKMVEMFDYTAYGKGKTYEVLQDILNTENDEKLIKKVGKILTKFNNDLKKLGTIENILVNKYLFEHFVLRAKDISIKLLQEFPDSRCHSYVQNIILTKIKIHFRKFPNERI